MAIRFRLWIAAVRRPPVNATLLALLSKMVIVAGLVVATTALAERSRPALAALVATLPISIGPILVIMAIEHDASFLEAVILKSSASNGASMAFIAACCNALTRLRSPLALAFAYGAWAPAAMLVHRLEWTTPAVLVWIAAAALACHLATRRLKAFRPERPAARQWWDLPLRAVGVATFVGVLTGFSAAIGPSAAGTLASAPIVMTSVTVIAQARMGGLAAAALLSNALPGMIGISLALCVVHELMPWLGVTGALVAGLAFSLLWSAAWLLRQQKGIASTR